MKSNKLIYILLSGLVLSCNNPQSKQKEATPNATSKAVSKEEQAFLTEIKYSNLVDKISQEEVKKALIEAGVRPERLNSFFESVELFNQTVDEAGMVSQGFLTSNELKPNYDEVTIATQWRAKYPDFLGYNCRITSFSLLNDFVKIENPQIKNDQNLFMDKDALENTPKKVFSDKETDDFLSFFSQIPTVESKDVSKHIEIVEKDWQKKGISFVHKGDKSKASLISVFMHSFFDKNDNNLFIGHIGILVPFKNELLFIEKLAFEEPYQVTKLKNRGELNNLLMNRYDNEWEQPNAKPFIFENDSLLEGYRPNPNVKEPKN
ncbi:DUF4300 family protein [Capnocytophaga catalasegens]|uniref:Membrane protein n=1 Tax=Capnocytophaga catalasegens TaxID=1004260 RepID=A0AAV5B084_9FLAO|nr:DUF4300 family protein [Capnocytophaga catalasegens]GIZ16372.1 membrane protein [Capnocytophaga catalasegens]GJM51563.1 membrane protein [Capnocytophaga catalasegens]GJM54301.1 membrane protein [Capnocytophaga catalasegens]